MHPPSLGGLRFLRSPAFTLPANSRVNAEVELVDFLHVSLGVNHRVTSTASPLHDRSVSLLVTGPSAVKNGAPTAEGTFPSRSFRPLVTVLAMLSLPPVPRLSHYLCISTVIFLRASVLPYNKIPLSRLSSRSLGRPEHLASVHSMLPCRACTGRRVVHSWRT